MESTIVVTVVAETIGLDEAVAIVTVRPAVTRRRKFGSKNSVPSCCRFITSWSRSRFPVDSAWCCAYQREGYRCLFDSSADSIRDVGSATKSLKDCQLGFFGVLHTWGRDPLVYHPHIHYVVPGGGVKVDADGRAISWQATPKNFLFPHGTLIRVYKAKLADELRAAGLYDQVPAEVWDKDFVVDVQSVGHGEPTLKYLAPYIHRVAISDKRIVAVDDSSVTYTVTPSKSKQTITRKVPGKDFVAGFAQHVLPRRLSKDPSLRLDESELGYQASRSEMAGVAISRMDLLAGQRTCTTTETSHRTASLCRVWRRDASGGSDLRSGRFTERPGTCLL